MPLTIGDPIDGSTRPSFRAHLDGKPALIRLDSGAVFKLAKQATGPDLNQALAAKRDQILVAAARLADEGFTIQEEGVAEIWITALDL